MKRNLRAVVVGASLALTAVPANAQLAQCTSGLETLAAPAAVAHEQTSQLTSVEDGLVARREAFTCCQDELERVQRDRERRGDPAPSRLAQECRGAELSAQALEVSYTSAVAAVQDGLTTLASAVQAVEVSCQVPLGAFAAVPPPETRSPDCRSFLASRPGAPLAALRVVCE
ncbi:MAG TPA: hypothetical protein EYQ83_09740, partial [Acidobacteria bacterium]|nr:hypothetical protein [Acidobacteriota bacterium]